MPTAINAGKETKFARSDDRFEFTNPQSEQLSWLRHRIGDHERLVFSRAELTLDGIYIGRECLGRSLKPLTESCPEIFGLTAEEVLSKSLPQDTKDATLKIEALFKFFTAPTEFPLRLQCVQNANYGHAAFGLYAPTITPSCLELIFARALRRFIDGATQEAQNLAQRFLFELPADTYKGKGAEKALPFIIEELSKIDEDTNRPLWEGKLGLHLLGIISINNPLHRELRLPFLRVCRRYQRADMAPAEQEAALNAEFALLHL